VRYASTRSPEPGASLSDALSGGLAPDGGLYVPRTIPAIDARALGGRAPLAGLATTLLAPYFEGDALAPQLAVIAAESLDLAAPVRAVDEGAERLSILELFHGPTAAFKDFGARFLAACLARLQRPGAPPRSVLVATSGDTGGAVAAAFDGRPGARVVLLYPEGRVSPVQAHQLGCWGDNVRTLAVEGSFDDCQRLVKQAFADAKLRERFSLTSANSINIGRLLPQLVLFAGAALAVRESAGAPANFVIPSGNLGLATACAYARAMGLPIGEILLAHNANRTVPDFFEGGAWRPRPSVATLASAMDVGDPSNMERLFALYGDAASLKGAFRAMSIGDAAIRESVRAEFRRSGTVACPHTAAGLASYRALPERDRRAGPWVVVATAHPAKFPEIVEPLVGRRVTPPPALARLLERPSRSRRIAPSLDALVGQIEEAARAP
jgi:threonine synthase